MTLVVAADSSSAGDPSDTPAQSFEQRLASARQRVNADSAGSSRRGSSAGKPGRGGLKAAGRPEEAPAGAPKKKAPTLTGVDPALVEKQLKKKRELMQKALQEKNCDSPFLDDEPQKTRKSIFDIEREEDEAKHKAEPRKKPPLDMGEPRGARGGRKPRRRSGWVGRRVWLGRNVR